MLHRPVRQLGFSVKDVRRAAETHSKLFGSGPFFVVEDFEANCVYRGAKGTFRSDMALGQWGTMQVELFEQKDDTPTVLTDFFSGSGSRVGFHHAAVLVDDLNAAKQEMLDQGFSVAMESTVPAIELTGYFIDTVATYGHFIEMFEPVSELVRIWQLIADAAVGFDGSRPVRDMAF